MARFSLDDILGNDPLDLLEDLKVKNPIITADDRLIASFEEINLFFEEHKKEPSKNADMTQRGLYVRLEGIRNNPSKIEALKKYDRFNLLVDKSTKKVNSIDEIFENDPLGLLENTQDEDIFTLKNLPKTTTMPDYVASRKVCKEFEKYEHLFIKCQNDLKNGKRNIVKFQNEQQIKKGYFFILKGVLLYVLDVGKTFKSKGKSNARLKLIFENGTESDMLLRSLSAELYKHGKRVSEYDESKLEGLYEVNQDDKQNGYIYILRSLSTDDKITTKKDLYKIGFSTTDVETRIKNAKDDPTYLMADVKIVAAYEVYNVNPYKLEQLIHQFFARSCLGIDIVAKDGSISRPREWFIAPLNIIEEAIELIISGEIINYKYDTKNEIIISK